MFKKAVKLLMLGVFSLAFTGSASAEAIKKKYGYEQI